MNIQSKRRLSALVLAAVLAVMLAGCGKQPSQTQTGETAPTEEPTGIPLTTPYMTFYYPQEWEDKVEVTQANAGENITVTFHTDISGEAVVLFSVVLGPDEADGYLLGQLEDAEAGTVRVYSVMNEVSPEEWDPEAYNQICSLQERVNDLIVQLHEDARFTPAK